MQSNLVQLGITVNKIRIGFSDDLLNQRTAQRLDKVVEETKEKFNSISHPIPPKETPFQHWKRRACEDICTSKQREKATTLYVFFYYNCGSQGKIVALMFYI